MNEKKIQLSGSKSEYSEQPLLENLNRLQIDGEEARNVDDAIEILR